MYTAEQLSAMTVRELRDICVSRGITGMSKRRKDEIISAILANTRNDEAGQPGPTAIRGLQYDATSTRVSGGNQITTTIRVTSGASSGNYPVVGKTVGEVSRFLAEALNIDRMAQGIVNGDVKDDNYVLQANDSLEFLKPAGRKGF